MKKLGGGRWDLISIAVFLVLIILILSMGESFIPNNPNPGWRLSRLNPFQSSDGHLRYPPVYYLVFSKRTCYGDSPKKSDIIGRFTIQSRRANSTNVVPT